MSQIFYFLEHEQFQPEILIKHAQIAEEAGFDGLVVSEHFNPWVADKGAAGFAFSTLGALAQVTKKVKLMTGVVAPLFRFHPAVVAQAAATIDRLSDGRFILGVGTGESLNETPLGYYFPNYQERSERITEALQIITRLLRGEKVTFDGKYYKTQKAKLYSPPFHYVPTLLAAGGPKSAALAGEYADGVIASVKDVEKTASTIFNPAKEKANNKKFLTSSSRWTIFAQDDDEAWEALLAWRGLRAPNRDTAVDPEDLQKEADSLPRKDILSQYAIVKSAQEYIDIYKPLVTHLNSDIVGIQTTGIDQEKLIEMLGKDVLPTLKKAHAK